MLASLLHLIDAPTQIASLYVVASTDAGGWMHNNGKLPYLGGFAYPPNCTPNHKKIAPPQKTVPMPALPKRSGREESRLRIHMVYGDYQCREEVIRRRREVKRMASWWAFGETPFVTIRPHAENGASAPPVSRIGPRRDIRRIPRVWRGCRCLGVGV